jgi:hypothetical protein
MKRALPTPDFDDQNYARPNQKWTCGRACAGNACRIGPDARGNCQATTECRPVLETKPGETKGRWRCTRSSGACETGPLPDGSCCRPIARCSPVPTLRVWRGRVTLAVVAAACALILLVTDNPPWRNRFISPGELARVHSGAAFAALAVTNGIGQNCGACHVAGNRGPYGMVKTAFNARPGIFDVEETALARAGVPTGLDGACLKCHVGSDFHQRDAAPISCSFCHAEHQGAIIAATTDANCNFCHGNPAVMAVSRTPTVIHHFADDHPQFRFITEKRSDPDTLRFNHELHMTGTTIPRLPDGRKLDCEFCHKPDAAGTYMRPVDFEQNCRVCHSLQFDPATPELMLPHGSASFVSAFLRSLPKQYADLAAREHVADVDGFAGRKLAALRAQAGNGEDLERRVFFSTSTAGPAAQVGMLTGTTRAVFPGCAYCHEVKATADGSPAITPPVIPERWLTEARFNHAKHATLACTQCHAALTSRLTSDILLPGRETCVECHSPRGGVANTCAECHTYHKPLLAQQ